MHTPGPWMVSRTEPVNEFPQVMVGQPDRRGQENGYSLSLAPRNVCQVFNQHDAEDDANAALISAAPDLLRACRIMRDALTEYMNGVDLCWRDWSKAYEIDAAIAKAEGSHDPH